MPTVANTVFILSILLVALFLDTSLAKKGNDGGKGGKGGKGNGGGGWNAGQICTFDPSSNFNSTAFYTNPNRTEFIYPQSTGSLVVNNKNGPSLRIVCPGGKIFANGNVTAFTAAVAECVGGPTVKLADTYVYSPLQMIGCNGVQEPTAQLTGKVASNGKKIAEVGYSLSMVDFLPVIDELVVSSFNGGYIPRWAHHKVITSKVDDESKAKQVSLKTGPLAAKVPFAEVYSAAKQRGEFLKLFANDVAIVDKYLPTGGKQQFVATRLVGEDELYYPVQRTGSHLYETSVPVWSSIATGNWKLVSQAVRDLVPVTNTTSPVSNVDVWSGSYLALYLPNTAGKNVYVGLPHGLKPAQFLFKYVHDPTNNQGLVFVTVNNPHLTEATKNNVLCKPLPSCTTKYPDFADFTKGYTYCCSLKDFKDQAQKLGLPIFKDVTDLSF